VRECFEQLSQPLKKSSYVFLEKASRHKSHTFIPHRAQWGKRGLMIKSLPPYSPELHLIEILGRFMNYAWRPFSAYVSLQCLLQSVEDILQRFGTDYPIAFEMKGIDKNLCPPT
jgi:DDE superfamily endonuclease